MINLACGVIRISNTCSFLEIFDQQGNLNLTPLVVIPYQTILKRKIETLELSAIKLSELGSSHKLQVRCIFDATNCIKKKKQNHRVVSYITE